MRLRTQAAYSIAGFVAPAISALVGYRLLYDAYGMELTGIIMLATSFTGLLSFASLGFTEATIRYTAKAEGSAGNEGDMSRPIVLVTSTAFYFLTGLIVAVAIVAFSGPLSTGIDTELIGQGEVTKVFLLGACYAFWSFPLSNAMAFFKGLRRFDVVAISSTLVAITTYVGGGGAAIRGGLSAGGYLLWASAIEVVAFIVLMAMALRLTGAKWRDLPRLAQKKAFITMISFASITAVTALAASTFYQGQRYLVGVVDGAAAAGAFSLAMTATSKIHSLCRAGAQVLFPLSSTSSNMRMLRRNYLITSGSSLAVAVFAMLPLMLWPELVVRLWLGEAAVATTAPLLVALAVAYLFLALSPAAYFVSSGLGMPGMNSFNVVLRVLLFVAVIFAYGYNRLSGLSVAWIFAGVSISVNGLIWPLVVEFVIWRPRLSCCKVSQ